jgi:hypothetical protein
MAVPQVITLRDIEELSARLLARGKSRMVSDTPSSKADILLAAKLLARWIPRGVELGAPFDLDD